ncbi:hypothetical protein D3C78_1967970 [compost metagenome]
MVEWLFVETLEVLKLQTSLLVVARDGVLQPSLFVHHHADVVQYPHRYRGTRLDQLL